VLKGKKSSKNLNFWAEIFFSRKKHFKEGGRNVEQEAEH
jgi:hypothetical protein